MDRAHGDLTLLNKVHQKPLAHPGLLVSSLGNPRGQIRRCTSAVHSISRHFAIREWLGTAVHRQGHSLFFSGGGGGRQWQNKWNKGKQEWSTSLLMKPGPPNNCVTVVDGRLLEVGGQPTVAEGQLRGSTSAILAIGFVLSCRGPLWMFLFGTAKGHNRSGAISKIMKRVPSALCSVTVQCWGEEGVLMQFLWPKCLLSFAATLGAGKYLDIRDATTTKVAQRKYSP